MESPISSINRGGEEYVLEPRERLNVGKAIMIGSLCCIEEVVVR